MHPKVNLTFETSSVVFTSQSSIGSKIFNVSTPVSSLDVVKHQTILPWKYQILEFKDDHHNHILTGRLHIESYNQFLILYSKGSKFHEKRNQGWQVARPHVSDSLNNCIKKLSNKSKISVHACYKFKEQIVISNCN